MRERGVGTIVNVSSTSGNGVRRRPDYSVMKAALLSFSRLVADVHAADGIRCNAVTPGPTATDAWLGEVGLPSSRATATACSRRSPLADRSAGSPSPARSRR